MKTATIHVSVNQQIHISEVPVQQTLLSYLRDSLNLTATKTGCNGGECGACMVLLNEEPVNSCMVLAVECDGQQVDTLEGLNQSPLMKILQEAFHEQGAVQCGFCTPGMLISSYSYLLANATPNEEEIKNALSGNLCRCSGYQVIIRSVQQAARMAEEGDV
ncbi:MAG: (2Fe-2S)-binding protein [Anaerolineaceae bacterium]|nr:(2Fe-2S)-binding protein [Anaerolineaceae bacterium]